MNTYKYFILDEMQMIPQIVDGIFETRKQANDWASEHCALWSILKFRLIEHQCAGGAIVRRYIFDRKV